jgi:hypothetical protein
MRTHNAHDQNQELTLVMKIEAIARTHPWSSLAEPDRLQRCFDVNL